MQANLNWQLGDELRVRADVVEAIYDLAVQLGQTLDFYQQKAEAAYHNQMVEYKVMDKIMEVAIAEMFNLIDKLAPASEMVKTAILPIAYIEPKKAICDRLKQAEDSIYWTLEPDKDPTLATFIKLKAKLLREITQFEINLYWNQEGTAETFNQMLERYKQEYAESLRYYVDDICSVAEAKTQLRKDYQHSPAVQSWNHEGRDIERVFRDLRLKQVTEQELLPLIEYIAKYEALDECKKDTPQTAGTIVHGNYIEHQNVEQQYNN